MISCVSWVPRGALKAVPIEDDLSKEEIEMLIAKQEELAINEKDEEKKEEKKEGKGGADDDEEEEEDEGDEEMEDKTQTKALPPLPADDDDDLDPEQAAFMKQLDLDNYDEEEEGASLLLGGKNLTVFNTNNADPYITVPDDEDLSEDEDTHLKPDDSIFLMARTEEEHSTLEVWAFEEATGNLYTHHDLTLPAFPLCLQYLDFDPRSGEQGSFVAVGTFQPGIEIWNLDVMHALEPVCTLGGRGEPDKAKIQAMKKKKKGKVKMTPSLQDTLLGPIKPGSHTDAVMSLAWHHAHRERLASGSADNTVKLWDIKTQTATATLTHHSNKVQSMEWNPSEPSVLLSGAYDRVVAMTDTRNPSKPITISVDSDIESCRWSGLNPALFGVATESGTVTVHDARKGGGPSAKPLFTLSAHNKACSSISFSGVAPLFATASLDKTVKIWSMEENKPSMIASRDMQIGTLYSMAFDDRRGNPFVLVAGGNKGKVAVWDTMENQEVSKRYGHLAKPTQAQVTQTTQPAASSCSASSSSLIPKKRGLKKKKAKAKSKNGQKAEPAEDD